MRALRQRRRYKRDMPELAEVEIARRALAQRLVGRGAVSLELRDPRLLKRGVPGAAAPVARVRRRAKWLLLEHGEDIWCLHLRMTGRLTRTDGRGVRAVLRPASGAAVWLEDLRCLGELHVIPAAEEAVWFAERRLGDEPWPEVRPGPWWETRLGGLRSSVKVALLRQDRVAGLGNIAASEILWRAGIAPTLPARSVDLAAWQRIGQETVAHLNHLLAVEDADIVYVTQGGDNPFRVYGREGEPCPRCSTPIRRSVQSGRATFACPGCQER